MPVINTIKYQMALLPPDSGFIWVAVGDDRIKGGWVMGALICRPAGVGERFSAAVF